MRKTCLMFYSLIAPPTRRKTNVVQRCYSSWYFRNC